MNWGRALRWLFSPMSWSVAKRRMFLVLLPLSLPAWALAVLGILALSVLEGLISPLWTFWSAPPRSRGRGYDYYGRAGR